MIVFEEPAQFDAWLHENGANETELWLKYAKKGSGIKTITYAEALDVALCHGWIDGLTRSVDETYYSQTGFYSQYRYGKPRNYTVSLTYAF